MKKSLSIFIFALFFHSFLYANPQQDLQQALAQLASHLQSLQAALNKIAKPTVAPSAEPPINMLPYELVYYITEKTIFPIH